MLILSNKGTQSSTTDITSNLQAATGWSTGLKAELKETGLVTSIGDGVAKVVGLTDVQAGEQVLFESGSKPCLAKRAGFGHAAGKGCAFFVLSKLSPSLCSIRCSIPWTLFGAVASTDNSTSLLYKLLPVCVGVCVWTIFRFTRQAYCSTRPKWKNVEPTFQTLPNKAKTGAAPDWSPLYEGPSKVSTIKVYEQSAAFSESCRAHQDSTLSLIHRVLKLRTDLFNAVIAEAQGIDPVRLSELQTAAGNFAYQLGGLTPEFSSIREYNVYHLTVELARATTEALYLQRVMRAYDKTHSNGVACPNTIFFDENLHASQTEMGLFSNFSVTARVVFILLQIAIPCYQYYRPIILIWYSSLTTCNKRRTDPFSLLTQRAPLSLVYEPYLHPFSAASAHSAFPVATPRPPITCNNKLLTKPRHVF